MAAALVKPGAERGLRGLNRVLGNLHARFLGEDKAVMPCPYPTVFQLWGVVNWCYRLILGIHVVF